MKNVIYSIVFLFMPLLVFPQTASYEDFSEIIPKEKLTNEELQRLKTEGEVFIRRDTYSTELAPKVYFKSKPLDEYLRSVSETETNICIQHLLLVPLEKSYSPRAIYNTLLSVSTMSGIEYFSHSRQRYRIFYHTVYAVSEMNRNSQIPDPELTERNLPEEKELLIYQHDSSFGKYYTQLRYLYDGKSFILSMENKTSLIYKLIRVLKPGNLRIKFFIKPSSKGLLLYVHCSADAATLFGLDKRVEKSLTNRLRAIAEWFTATLTEY
jgi:hypothetical protein